MSAKPKISPVRTKNTTIAPRGGPRVSPRFAEAWTDNTEQAFMFIYEPPENPMWLVGD